MGYIMEVNSFVQNKIFPFLAELAFKIVQEALKKVGEEVKWSELITIINKNIEESQVPKALHGFLERFCEFLINEVSKFFSTETIKKYEDVNSWSLAFFGKKLFEDPQLGESQKLLKI